MAAGAGATSAAVEYVVNKRTVDVAPAAASALRAAEKEARGLADDRGLRLGALVNSRMTAVTVPAPNPVALATPPARIRVPAVPRTVDVVKRYTWTTDTLIGLLYSSSTQLRAELGARVGEFERDLRDRLLRLAPDDRFGLRHAAYWLDRTIPLKYRDAVTRGILEWNKAFERIGFKDAIHVEMQPENADFNTADLRHASVRWYLDTSDGALAIGPSRVDPRTGEILDADIGVSQGWTRLPRRLSGEQFPRPMPVGAQGRDEALCMYGNEAYQEEAFATGLMEARGELDPNGPEAEAIIKATLKDVITHEVGHTLGLRHNFRASTIYTEKQLADPEFTRKNGLGGSVMDYNAWNIALDKEKQGEYVMSTLGPYDYWAIEYAYKPIDPAREKAELAKIAARNAEPYLAYATDEETATDGMDPQVNARDLGSDPLGFAKRRMQLSRELWDRWQAKTLRPDESREVLYRNMVSGFLQYALAAQVATKYVGGVVYVRDYAGSSRASFTPIEPARQREALKVVTDGVFKADSFRFKPEFLTRIAADPFDTGAAERRPQVHHAAEQARGNAQRHGRF